MFDLPKPKYIEFPVTISKINRTKNDKAIVKGISRAKCGDFVKVRPCAEEYENKTYLGIYLGDVALGISVSMKVDSDELDVGFSHYNPAILIPDRGTIVYGCGSWWGVIKSPEDLKNISDIDIDNVWYVKALKNLDNKETTP